MYETQYSYFINPATKKFLQTDEAHSPITTPPSFYFGDRPKFTLSFPADTIAEGDTLVAVLDNENRFLDTKQATGLNPVMTGVLHEITSEEASAQSLEIQLFNYSKKFADVINGHDNAVTCLFTVYLKSTDGEGNFTFVELGQTIANGEPTVTSPECIWDDLPVTKYYTRDELDAIYNQFLAGVSLVVEYSNLAKSYAVGGTGTREGEDEDNAKYYAEMASQAANAVSTMYSSIQTIATQIANTKEYIDGLVESIAIDIRDISEIAASVTSAAAQVSRDAKSVRQAKSSIDASVQFVSQAKSTVENLATQVSQNAVDVANNKDTVAQLAVQVSNAASQVSRDKADAKGYSESAATSLANVQTIQTDVTQKQTDVTTMKNTIQRWYNQISSWYNSIQSFMEQMQGWWTDVDTWQQQVSDDKDVVVSSKDTAVQAKNDAVAAKTAAETAQTKAEEAQTGAEDARDEAVATLANKRDILQTLVTSSSTALVVEAGKSYSWTVVAASTIALSAADKVAGKETRIDIYIDLQDGGSVTGDGVTVADAVLQGGWYKLIWDGTGATLYSTKAGGATSVVTIPAATTAYTLQDNKHYQQIPSAVPTYTLPSVTADGLVHEITVLVDFLHVTSCSFVDAGGVPVTLQSAISPQIGEAYVFRCYWYGKWRVVPLKIRNAATASSATGVVEVSDAVGGEALALRMVAPRSVVVNQMMSSDVASTSILTNNGDGSFTFTGTQQSANNYRLNAGNTNIIAGHKYILTGFVDGGSNLTFSLRYNKNGFGLNNNSSIVLTGVDSTSPESKQIGINTTYPMLFVAAGQELSITFRPQLVDLTQYFNGDTALIDSIQTWDDLVAYDPRFAQYVEYNTGEVKGVQPTVMVTGKNLFDQSLFLTSVSGCTLTDGYYTGTTQKFYNSTSGTKSLFNGFIPNAQYSVRYNGYSDVANGWNIKITHTDGSVVQTAFSSTTPTDYTLTSTAGKTVSRIWIGWNSSKMTYIKNVQIEIASFATSYEPYHDGGTAQAPAPLFAVDNAADEFEAVAGVTTHRMASVDAGNIDWRYSSNLQVFYRNISGMARQNNVISSTWRRTTAEYSSMPDMSIRQVSDYSASGSSDLVIKDSRYSDTTAFKNAVVGMTIYYELATPTTSASTPTQISLQAGSNTAMQTDGGRTLAELAMTYENLPTES